MKVSLVVLSVLGALWLSGCGMHSQASLLGRTEKSWRSMGIQLKRPLHPAHLTRGQAIKLAGKWGAVAKGHSIVAKYGSMIPEKAKAPSGPWTRTDVWVVSVTGLKLPLPDEPLGTRHQIFNHFFTVVLNDRTGQMYIRGEAA